MKRIIITVTSLVSFFSCHLPAATVIVDLTTSQDLHPDVVANIGSSQLMTFMSTAGGHDFQRPILTVSALMQRYFELWENQAFGLWTRQVMIPAMRLDQVFYFYPGGRPFRKDWERIRASL